MGIAGEKEVHAVVAVLRDERRGYPLGVEIASRHTCDAAAKRRTRPQPDFVGKEFCYWSFRGGPNEGIEIPCERPLEGARPRIDQQEPRHGAKHQDGRTTLRIKCADLEVQRPKCGGGCVRCKDAVEG